MRSGYTDCCENYADLCFACLAVIVSLLVLLHSCRLPCSLFPILTSSCALFFLSFPCLFSFLMSSSSLSDLTDRLHDLVIAVITAMKSNGNERKRLRAWRALTKFCVSNNTKTIGFSTVNHQHAIEHLRVDRDSYAHLVMKPQQFNDEIKKSCEGKWVTTAIVLCFSCCMIAHCLVLFALFLLFSFCRSWALRLADLSPDALNDAVNNVARQLRVCSNRKRTEEEQEEREKKRCLLDDPLVDSWFVCFCFSLLFLLSLALRCSFAQKVVRHAGHWTAPDTSEAHVQLFVTQFYIETMEVVKGEKVGLMGDGTNPTNAQGERLFPEYELRMYSEKLLSDSDAKWRGPVEIVTAWKSIVLHVVEVCGESQILCERTLTQSSSSQSFDGFLFWRICVCVCPIRSNVRT